jgi:hypothetical protein
MDPVIKKHIENQSRLDLPNTFALKDTIKEAIPFKLVSDKDSDIKK